MIPLWAISGLAAAAVAGFVGWKAGAGIEGAKLERERTAWANERTQAAQRHAAALQSEINAHNTARNELDAIHANAQADRAIAAAQAASAAAALAAADRSAGRLRDAIETNRLATRAALDAAGAAGLCAPATAAADVLAELLGGYRALAGRLAEAGRASSGDADAQFGAARECAASADSMIRASAKMPAAP